MCCSFIKAASGRRLLLCPFWTSLTLLPRSSVSFSVMLPLVLPVSTAHWIISPLLFLFSHLFHPSCVFLLTLLPHQLNLCVFLQTKAPLSLFICTVLPWFYLPLLPIPLIFILPVVSHIPFLMCPRVCYSPSLSSFLSYLTSRLPHHHHHHPFLLLSHVRFVFFPPSVFSLIVLSRADRHCLWDVYRQNA